MYAAPFAARTPDAPAIVMAADGSTTTFARYEAEANRIAHVLRDSGLRRYDHVAFLLENGPTLLECEGAAERTGLYYTCINTHLGADEVAYIVGDCDADLVVISAAHSAIAGELRERCGRVRRWLVAGLDAAPPGYERLEDVVADRPPTPVDDEQLGAPMLYSSGTTGRPKGILRPLPTTHPTEPFPLVDVVRRMFRFREGMRYLSPAPLYHSAPQASVAGALRLGAPSVIMERFDAERWMQLVERYRITHTQMVPTMFSRLLKLPDEVRARYDLSSLEAVIHAAAPCPEAVKRQMIDWLGPIVIEYYGSTESNGLTVCDSEEWLAHPGTVGRAFLGELQIRDEKRRPVPAGTVGTVWFCGATGFEYYNDPAKTAEATSDDGACSTVGDVGYVDEEGYLYLTDRKAYMIISGGVNIYPQETEDLLIGHPKVLDAAVIGVPNDDLGEEVKAIVQLVPGATGGPDVARELVEYCRAHLAAYKCPRSIDFEAELPRSPTGKLMKRLLRDRYWPERATAATRG